MNAGSIPASVYVVVIVGHCATANIIISIGIC